MILDFGMRNYDLQAVPEYARKVEAIGYGCLWTSAPQHAPPFLPLAAAATANSSLKLGTSIAVAFRAARWSLPTQPGTFRRLRLGRFRLGLGVACSLQEIRSTPVRAPGAKDEDYFPGT
jgi:alkanesulfonate monooxygenase SsuD/methylene tetrahydromethanopterin reductase-like flavin-dependent oxidoreductase (luciferase family)